MGQSHRCILNKLTSLIPVMSWPSAQEPQYHWHPLENYHLSRPVDPGQSLQLARTHLRHELDVFLCPVGLLPAPAMHQQELGEGDNDINPLQTSHLTLILINPFGTKYSLTLQYNLCSVILPLTPYQPPQWCRLQLHHLETWRARPSV